MNFSSDESTTKNKIFHEKLTAGQFVSDGWKNFYVNFSSQFPSSIVRKLLAGECRVPVYFIKAAEVTAIHDKSVSFGSEKK